MVFEAKNIPYAAFDHPEYELSTLKSAEAYRFPDFALPAKEFLKLALGSETDLTPPPRTTQPVMTMNSRMMTLIDPITFISHTPALGVNVCTQVTNTMTAMAIPRSSHSVGVLPLATTILDAKTMQPDAVNPSKIACTANTIVARKRGRRYTASR